MSLYQALKDAGCLLDHHESDLYVLATKVAFDIINKHESYSMNKFFKSTDSRMWFEIPFAYEPYWQI